MLVDRRVAREGSRLQARLWKGRVLSGNGRELQPGVLQAWLYVLMLLWMLGVMFVLWLTQFPLLLPIIAHRIPFLGFLIPLREVLLRFFTARYLF
jgi:hypothetical protein